MKAQSYTLQFIADYVDGELKGDPSITVDDVKTLAQATEGCLSFLHHEKYLAELKQTNASVVLLSREFAQDCSTNMIIVDNPYLALSKILMVLQKAKQKKAKVHRRALIGKNCQVGKRVSVGAYSVIGDRVVIGEDVVIGAHVTIDDDCVIEANSVLHNQVTLYPKVTLGQRVVIHSGTVVGSDGFGNAQDADGQWHKMPQLGSVHIEDDVEIGANTTIDCGSFNHTHIASGVKIDNQVQIAHNVQIGRNTAIAGCVGIAGSTKIGANCMIAGGSGIGGHLEIADNTVITGMAMITKSIEKSGMYSSGTGFLASKSWRRMVARLRNIDQLFSRLKKLEQQNEAQ